MDIAGESKPSVWRSEQMPPYSNTLPVCATAALLVMSGLLNSPHRIRRAAAFFCACLTFVTPWFLPADALFARGFCAAAAALAVLSTVRWVLFAIWRASMLTLVSTGAYFGIILVLAVLVLRERRRARLLARLTTKRLPYDMACTNR